MNKEFDFIVYIGRFQPLHNGHLATILKAFDAGRELIMVVGSANAAPTPINPFSAQDRIDMVTEELGRIDPKLLNKVHFITAEDRLYNMNKWIGYVQAKVSDIVKGGKVALIGHDKGDNEYSLKNLFPSWGFVDTGAYVKIGSKVVSASKIRELIFQGHLDYTESNLPESVFETLEEFVQTSEFDNLQGEYIHYLAEEKVVDLTPHGMIFMTADSVVVQSGHILLVRRGEYPGKGLWALPGVHVGHNETVDQASIRALVDETHLKVPERVLSGSLRGIKLFDHPERSLRARLTQKRARSMTMAYYYELDSSKPLPTNVRGGKGIEKAWWFTFAEVRKMRSQLFEDHADIVDYFIG